MHAEEPVLEAPERILIRTNTFSCGLCGLVDFVGEDGLRGEVWKATLGTRAGCSGFQGGYNKIESRRHEGFGLCESDMTVIIDA